MRAGGGSLNECRRTLFRPRCYGLLPLPGEVTGALEKSWAEEEGGELGKDEHGSQMLGLWGVEAQNSSTPGMLDLERDLVVIQNDLCILHVEKLQPEGTMELAQGNLVGLMA